ncbi:MAG: hypothetical protein WCX65_18135, partial [bacterium]
ERLEDIVSGQMKYSYFPVKLDHMAANINFVELKECSFEVEGVKVTAQYLNHPILVLGYRFEYNGKVVVTEFDTEPYSNVFKKDDSDMDDFLFGDNSAPASDKENETSDIDGVADPIVMEMNNRVKRFAKDADLLIFDAQYTKEEYPTKVGWGHSSLDDAIDLCIESNVKRLAFFHHDPTRSDDALDAMEKYAQDELHKRGFKNSHIFAAREGMEIDV